MIALLDTHVFLWGILDGSKLSHNARKVWEDGRNTLLLSAVSGWELAIKSKMGKLRTPAPLESFLHKEISAHGIEILPIQMRHVLHTTSLPDHHKDPFDRLLVAQSQLEKLPIMTADPWISQYNIRVIW